MQVTDIIIIVAVLISVVIGFLRGFVKEAFSIVTLLAAIWAALHLAPLGQSLVDNFVGSHGLQLWLGRALVFFVVLTLGGLLGWGLSKLINKSGLSGTDRVLGMGFGFARGALLLGLFALASEHAGFAEDTWWKNSRLMPHAQRIGGVIKALAPKALEYIRDVDGKITGATEEQPVPEGAN